ncbi:MAG: hypothetical protein ACOCX4_09650 [Planctomycetota bacterium]
MPKEKPDPPYFACLCTEAELRAHLLACADTAFHTILDRERGIVRVHDRDTILLDAVKTGGGWMVRLHRRYYRHPFHGSDGVAPPGAR